MNQHFTVLVSLSLLLAGCGGPSQTLRQLGHPAFEEVVGKDTLYSRADPEQRMGMDAYTGDVDSDGDHSFIISFWPAGTEEKIGLEVRARGKGQLNLESLAAAVFPITRQQAQRFEAIGELPDPSATPIAFSGASEQDESGNTVLYLFFLRSAIPAGTEWLAIPTLARFADGWIHVRYYETAIPEAMKLRVLPPETVPAKPAEEEPTQTPGATKPSSG